MAKKLRFAIVAGTYNRKYVDALVSATQLALTEHKVTIVRVPGAFEIPLQVQRLARAKRYDAIIALGVVWHGKTEHATEILRAVTDALMRLGLKYDVPIVHQVLSVKTKEEAEARTMGKTLNRGREAARVALAMAALKG